MGLQLLLLGGLYAALQLLPGPKSRKENRHGMEANRGSGINQRGDYDRRLPRGDSAAEPVGRELDPPAPAPESVRLADTETRPEPAPESTTVSDPEPAQATISPAPPEKE